MCRKLERTAVTFPCTRRPTDQLKMHRVAEIHPSHLAVVASSILAHQPDPKMYEWGWCLPCDDSREYIRSYARCRPEASVRKMAADAVCGSRRCFELPIFIVCKVAAEARATPKPTASAPCRTNADERSWLLPLELKDVWPRIFAELVSADLNVQARKLQQRRDRGSRPDRVKGVVRAMADGPVDVWRIAASLRGWTDLTEVMRGVIGSDVSSDTSEITHPDLFRAVARQMGLTGPLPPIGALPDDATSAARIASAGYMIPEGFSQPRGLLGFANWTDFRSTSDHMRGAADRDVGQATGQEDQEGSGRNDPVGPTIASGWRACVSEHLV